MNNFTYRTNEEKDNLEAILRKRQRKFNTQQWVARGIMVLIAVSVVLYIINHTYYTTFDGYVHVDKNKVRAPFDIYLDSIYVSTGDIVYPGDTLYSYYTISTMLERYNPNRETDVVSSNRNLKIKQQDAWRQITVLKVRIEELQKQIAVENHNISLGLSSNSHKLDLQRELSETQARLRSLQNEYWMYGNIIRDLPEDLGHGAGAMIFDNGRSNYFHHSKSYNVSTDSSIIVDIKAPDHTILFQKEDILHTQHLNLESNNLSIIAYIPVENMHRITLDTEAEVRVNDEFVFKAQVKALGLRTEEIPEELRSYFAKKNTALIAELKILPDQLLPFWCLASGLPIDLRVKNIDTWRKKTDEKNYLWYVTGQGVSKGFPEEAQVIDPVTSQPKHRKEAKADTLKADSLKAKEDSLKAKALTPTTAAANPASATKTPGAAATTTTPAAAAGTTIPTAAATTTPAAATTANSAPSATTANSAPTTAPVVTPASTNPAPAARTTNTQSPANPSLTPAPATANPTSATTNQTPAASNTAPAAHQTPSTTPAPSGITSPAKTE